MRSEASRSSLPLPAEVLAFQLGSHTLGVDAARVRQVLRALALMPLPASPAVVEGVFSLRGEIVPVLDVRARFGLPAKPVELSDHLIVATTGARTIALRVDQALDLREFDRASLRDATSISPAIGFAGGVVTMANGIVLICDLDAFLSTIEAAEIETALERFDRPADAAS